VLLGRLIVVVHHGLHPVGDVASSTLQLRNFLAIECLVFQLTNTIFGYFVGPVELWLFSVMDFVCIEQHGPFELIYLPVEMTTSDSSVLEASGEAHHLVHDVRKEFLQVSILESLAE
jgi:hypothetical protein